MRAAVKSPTFAHSILRLFEAGRVGSRERCQGAEKESTASHLFYPSLKWQWKSVSGR